MAPPLWVAVLLLVVPVGALAPAEALNARGRIGEVRQTLSNILESIKDQAKDADALAKQRHAWCKKTREARQASEVATAKSLAQHRADLAQTKVAAVRVAGEVRQLQANISLLEAAADAEANRTRAVLEANRSLALKAQVDPTVGEVLKVQASISLLEANMAKAGHARALLPVDGPHGPSTHAAPAQSRKLAVLRVRLEGALQTLTELRQSHGELRRRIVDTVDAADAWSAYDAGLEAACTKGFTRMGKREGIRRSGLFAVEQAFQALVEQDVSVDQVNLMQEKENRRQLGRLRRRMHADGPFTKELERDESALSVVAEIPARPDKSASKVSEQVSRIRSLLAQLRKKEGTDGTQQKRWCKHERAQGEQALKVAQMVEARVAATVKAHTDAQRWLEQDLTLLAGDAAGLQDALEHVKSDVDHEQMLSMTDQKDNTLASKIINEASQILKALQQAEPKPSAVGKGEAAAAAVLDRAHASLLALVDTANADRLEAEDAAKDVQAKATTAGEVLTRARTDVELALDSHKLQLARLMPELGRLVVEAKDAASYLKELENACRPDQYSKVEKQGIDTQISALQDVQLFLSGRQLPTETTPGPAHALTPMEKAAAEMAAMGAENGS